ncbi:excinuclease ABC subunit UvrC [Marinigracilibium pacificum]|uniref:UvrABC system protein C n=1 Tax=Marinigracilibium pacificum TaxID=2729599 RepID=A0A848IRQ6_9BACT|nr:excinuclease ABC subunit UvrC [Marinigracilibium pacificum]NMM47153.1 excinuclease ABC subunit C [Marinigracilibium pacificum]
MDEFRYSPEEIKRLPDKPGVYKYYNKEDHLIYIGKAKNLKKRVSSYFNKSTGVSRKTRKMVSEIISIEVTIVNTEFDALLLENNLIKSHQPKYNILLRDDKTYPHVVVTNERFPRIHSTRKVEKGYGTYYGPYASVRAMKNIIELLHKLFQIRTCKYNLSENNIQKHKFKVCLEYHIGNCQGPCEGLQTEEDYNSKIKQAQNILKGELSIPKQFFKSQMQEAAANLAFEKAQEYKEKLLLLEDFQTRTTIVNTKLDDVDVITITSDEKRAYINYLKINQGQITATKTTEIKKKIEESDSEILASAIIEIRDVYQSNAKEVYTNIEIDYVIPDFTVIVPKIGDKKKLIDLSLKNALLYKKERIKNVESKAPPHMAVLTELKEALQLNSVPFHIECFDNSNLGGTNPVASMVCFKNAKPSKKDYRHFHIKTVEGPDDFASMYEVVTRRYSRLMRERQQLPDLVLIDGGKGQLSSAVSALKDMNLYGKVAIAGIAKRLEEIYVPEDSYPILISKKSPALKLLQHLRDEAHRFAITFHRKVRSKNTIKTSLSDIPGLGDKSIDKLLQHFGSVKNIKGADKEELAKIVGDSKATEIISYFSK